MFESQFETALEYYNQGFYKKSFLTLIEISNHMAHNIDYLQLLSEVQGRLGDYIAMSKTLDVIRKKTNTFEDHMSYVENQIKLGQDRNALTVLNALLNENTTIFQKQVVCRQIMNISIAASNLNSLRECINFYDENDLEDDVSCYAKALLDIQMNKVDSALENIRRSIEINPNNDSSWVTLAIVHRQMGDHDLAFANLEKALDINKYNAVAVKYYALWKQSAGQLDIARKKVGFYLAKYNFDEELTKRHIDLLNKSGLYDQAQNEQLKLTHFFATQAV